MANIVLWSSNECWLFPQDYVLLEKERGGLLRSRHLQYLLAFSYWPNVTPRVGGNIYEIRSYRLLIIELLSLHTFDDHTQLLICPLLKVIIVFLPL